MLYILVPKKENLEKVRRLYPYAWAHPIYFPQKKRPTLLMEHAAWEFLHDKIDMSADFVGTLSSRAHTKLSLQILSEVLNNKTILNYEYVNFQATSWIARDEAEVQHRGFTRAWDELCARVGNCNLYVKTCNSNYWMCKPLLFQRFAQWMTRVLLIYDTIPAMKQPTTYKTFHLLSPQQLIELWGKPYYPLGIFVLERFTLQFFRNFKCLLLPETNFKTPVHKNLLQNVEVLFLGVAILILVLVLCTTTKCGYRIYPQMTRELSLKLMGTK